MTNQEYTELSNLCYVRIAIGVMSQYRESNSNEDNLAGQSSAVLYQLCMALEKRVNTKMNEDVKND